MAGSTVSWIRFHKCGCTNFVCFDLILSLAKDNNDYIFAVTENSGQVAMVLIEKSGQVHINERAREKLKALWPAAYESNMEKLIPAFAKQLNEGEIPINGVKTVGSS